MGCLGRRSLSTGRMLQIRASTLVDSSDFRISKDPNPLWLDDCSGPEIHIDFAGRYQQVNVVMFRDILDSLQNIAQKDSWLRLHRAFDGLVHESADARTVE